MKRWLSRCSGRPPQPAPLAAVSNGARAGFALVVWLCAGLVLPGSTLGQSPDAQLRTFAEEDGNLLGRSLSAEGGLAAAGAPGTEVTGFLATTPLGPSVKTYINVGGVAMFRDTASGWQTEDSFHAPLGGPPDVEQGVRIGIRFGWDVSVQNERVLVGMPGGRIASFTYIPPGNVADYDSYDGVGQVYNYEFLPGTNEWTLTQIMVPERTGFEDPAVPYEPTKGQFFGYAIASAADWLAVGAPGDLFGPSTALWPPFLPSRPVQIFQYIDFVSPYACVSDTYVNAWPRPEVVQVSLEAVTGDFPFCPGCELFGIEIGKASWPIPETLLAGEGQVTSWNPDPDDPTKGELNLFPLPIPPPFEDYFQLPEIGQTVTASFAVGEGIATKVETLVEPPTVPCWISLGSDYDVEAVAAMLLELPGTLTLTDVEGTFNTGNKITWGAGTASTGGDGKVISWDGASGTLQFFWTEGAEPVAGQELCLLVNPACAGSKGTIGDVSAFGSFDEGATVGWREDWGDPQSAGGDGIVVSWSGEYRSLTFYRTTGDLPAAGEQLCTVTTPPCDPAQATIGRTFGVAFGAALAISDDASVLVVGAPYENEVSGAAHVYRQNIFSRYVLEASLRAFDAAEFDLFGSTVAIDGDRIAVGALLKECVPDPPDPTPGQGQICTPTADGNLALGAVYLYKGDGFGNWVLEQKILPPTSEVEQLMGAGIALSGEHLFAGAPGTTGVAPATGAVLHFVYDGSSWNWVETLESPNGFYDALFGSDVALDGTTLFAGSPNNDRVGRAQEGIETGDVYVFEDALDASLAMPEPGAAAAIAVLLMLGLLARRGRLRTS